MDKKTEQEVTDTVRAALGSGEARKMFALLKAFINTAQLTGYTPQQLGEVATVLSCLIYATAQAPKADYLAAVGEIYNSAATLAEEIGLELGDKPIPPPNVNSKGGAA